MIAPNEATLLNALDQAACIFEQLPLRPDGLRDYRYLFVNDAFRKLFGTPDLAGLSVRDNFPNEPESWYDDYDAVLLTGKAKRFVRAAPSQNMVLEMYVTRLEGGTGKRLMNTMRDISVEELMNEALQESEQRVKESEANVRNIIMQAPVAMALLSGPEFVVQIINASLITLWGKDDSIRGKPILEALPEMKGQPYPDILQRVYASGETYQGREEKVLLFRNGALQPGYFNFVNEPFRDARGKISGVIIVANEVTDQVLANHALRTALDQLSLSKEAASLGLFDMDLENGTLIWDPRCRELFGISHKNAVTYEDDFVKGLHPDDRSRIIQTINNCFVKAISNGTYDVEYRTIGQEDGKERWVRAKGQVYFGDDDRPMRFIGSVLDITEQKTDDLRKNDFIAMASHELKTPLTSLTAIVQLLSAKAPDKFTADALKTANKQVKKMAKLISGFLNISRLESGKLAIGKEPFDIAGLLREVADEEQTAISTHEIIFSKCDPVIVNGDREKIGSVISNFVSNAIKYSATGSSIVLGCEKTDESVKVTVTDQGSGIKPEDKERLFERYYRVEDKKYAHVGGFGIGLYLSAEIIHRHDGTIGVDSEPGKGSSFYFTLPIA